jgi:hypothetical protein
MAWQDRLANWVDGLLERMPAVDQWLELNFHAIGLHGPEVRHLMKTRFLPAAMAFSAVIAVLLVVALVRRARGGRRSPPAAEAS